MANPFAVVAIAVALSVGGSIALSRITAPVTPEPEEYAALTAKIDALDARFEDLRKELAAVKRQVTTRPATVRTPTGVDRDEIEGIVAAMLDRRGRARPGDAVEPEIRVQDAVADLLELGMNDDAAVTAYWTRLKAAGMAESVLEAFERRAEQNSDSAQAQFDLGTAYLQILQTADNQVQQGAYAMKADTKFDDALAIDDHHWGARFSKAISYSFYPPVMGMAASAIEHFEILAGQQEAGSAPQPGFDQTYVFLGNLYAQQGKNAKAEEIWRRGLTFHPDSGDLKGKIK